VGIGTHWNLLNFARICGNQTAASVYKWTETFVRCGNLIIDEQQIITRVLEGDTASFRRLVELHQRLVFQFVRNLLRNVEDAHDVTQDVFCGGLRESRDI